MKKFLLTVLLTALTLGVCTPTSCNHVHTEECGEDGVNCTHECNPIERYEKEWPDRN